MGKRSSQRNPEGGTRARRRIPSQADLIADVLADGEFHTVAEIHQRCGFSRLNSRVSELRSRRGMNIECRHVPGVEPGPHAYQYRLLLNEPSPPRPVAEGSLSGTGNTIDASPRSLSVDLLSGDDPAAGAAQLSLLEAAA